MCVCHVVIFCYFSSILSRACHKKVLSKVDRVKRHGWEKTREGFVEQIVDVSFSLTDEVGVIDAILGDDHGVLIVGSSYGVLHVASAPMTEARALRDELILTGQLGCSKIVVNSDRMEIISTMNEAGNSVSPAIYDESTVVVTGLSSIY